MKVWVWSILILFCLAGCATYSFQNHITINPSYGHSQRMGTVPLSGNVALQKNWKSNRHLQMKVTFDSLLTIYGFYLLFVIFSFEEINNKRRHAQNNFRTWCVSRKEKLHVLGINWEAEAWLEKDLIFHLLAFKIRIKEAKDRVEKKESLPGDDQKIECEKACNDYYHYIYECLKFKNVYKKWVIGLLIPLVLAKMVNIFISNFFETFSYIIISIIAILVLWMLRGSKFDFCNHPLTDKKDELSAEDRKEVKRLEDLIREI